MCVFFSFLFLRLGCRGLLTHITFTILLGQRTSADVASVNSPGIIETIASCKQKMWRLRRIILYDLKSPTFEKALATRIDSLHCICPFRSPQRPNVRTLRSHFWMHVPWHSHLNPKLSSIVSSYRITIRSLRLPLKVSQACSNPKQCASLVLVNTNCGRRTLTLRNASDSCQTEVQKG